jgi:DNA invertase Pin-like site-specific DNA recombinase
MDSPMKAFLYARVSTGDQNEGMQVREMRELAERRGCDLEVFIDAGFSGAKAQRPELDRMMQLVRRGKCDVVIVYRFDRFARSTQHLVNALEEFRALGVEFISVHEAIDTTTPMGRFAFAVFAAIAEFERELIRERVRSGMAHARANGQHIGRPALGLDAVAITRLREQGLPWREVAHRVKADESTVRKFMRRHAEKGSENSEAVAVENKAVAKAVEN